MKLKVTRNRLDKLYIRERDETYCIYGTITYAAYLAFLFLILTKQAVHFLEHTRNIYVAVPWGWPNHLSIRNISRSIWLWRNHLLLLANSTTGMARLASWGSSERRSLRVTCAASAAANSLFSSNSFSVTSESQLNAPSKVSGLERSKTIATPCAYWKKRPRNAFL